jgi:hypothetical protein
MAIIYSYPYAAITTADNLLGTQYDVDGLPTKSFSVQDLVNLTANTITAGSWTGIFNTSDILQVTVVNGIITNVVISG